MPESPADAGVTAHDVSLALREALTPLQLEVNDDSAAHAGHAGAREGRHFSVLVVSDSFVGLSRVARHRLVYHALRLLIPRGIHAVAIDARAPGDAA